MMKPAMLFRPVPAAEFARIRAASSNLYRPPSADDNCDRLAGRECSAAPLFSSMPRRVVGPGKRSRDKRLTPVNKRARTDRPPGAWLGSRRGGAYVTSAPPRADDYRLVQIRATPLTALVLGLRDVELRTYPLPLGRYIARAPMEDEPPPGLAFVWEELRRDPRMPKREAMIRRGVMAAAFTITAVRVNHTGLYEHTIAGIVRFPNPPPAPHAGFEGVLRLKDLVWRYSTSEHGDHVARCAEAIDAMCVSLRVMRMLRDRPTPIYLHVGNFEDDGATFTRRRLVAHSRALPHPLRTVIAMHTLFRGIKLSGHLVGSCMEAKKEGANSKDIDHRWGEVRFRHQALHSPHQFPACISTGHPCLVRLSGEIR